MMTQCNNHYQTNVNTSVMTYIALQNPPTQLLSLVIYKYEVVQLQFRHILPWCHSAAKDYEIEVSCGRVSDGKRENDRLFNFPYHDQ